MTTPITVTIERDECPDCEESWHFDAIPVMDKMPLMDIGQGQSCVAITDMRVVAWQLCCRICGNLRYEIELDKPEPILETFGLRLHDQLVTLHSVEAE